jgi:catechol 2,3-dioxygenase-like lactoylglutathione lyase family enzyme
MAKLRHIALATNDPIKTAEFYKQAFGFEEVGRTGDANSPKGIAWGIYLSDGTLNMAILKFKNVDQLGKGLDYVGIHHFGVLVEDVEDFTKKLDSLGAKHYIDQGQDGHQAGYFEKKFFGPEGVLFDIAEHGWAGAEPLPVPTKAAAE